MCVIKKNNKAQEEYETHHLSAKENRLWEVTSHLLSEDPGHMRSRFLVGEHNEVDPRATRVLQHGLQHLLQLEDDRPLLVALAPDPAQDDPHVDEVLLDVGDRGRVDQEVMDTVVPHLTILTKSMRKEVSQDWITRLVSSCDTSRVSFECALLLGVLSFPLLLGIMHRIFYPD